MLPSGMWWSNTPMFDIFFIHFGLLAPKDFKVLDFYFCDHDLLVEGYFGNVSSALSSISMVLLVEVALST